MTLMIKELEHFRTYMQNSLDTAMEGFRTTLENNGFTVTSEDIEEGDRETMAFVFASSTEIQPPKPKPGEDWDDNEPTITPNNMRTLHDNIINDVKAATKDVIDNMPAQKICVNKKYSIFIADIEERYYPPILTAVAILPLHFEHGCDNWEMDLSDKAWAKFFSNYLKNSNENKIEEF
jgi:hypothetical protein